MTPYEYALRDNSPDLLFLTVWLNDWTIEQGFRLMQALAWKAIYQRSLKRMVEPPPIPTTNDEWWERQANEAGQEYIACLKKLEAM